MIVSKKLKKKKRKIDVRRFISECKYKWFKPQYMWLSLNESSDKLLCF